MVLVDTNVWVRCEERDNPLSSRCAGTITDLRSQGEDLCICAQVIIEFWAVATRPVSANGLGMTPEAASAGIEDLLSFCALLSEPPDLAERWRALATKYKVTGKRCHDLRLVALAASHGVSTILTLNKGDFSAFSEIEVREPSLPR